MSTVTPPPPTVRPRQAAPARRAWSWSDVNLVLDAVLLAVFAAQCGAAVIVRFVFPPGPAADGWTLWGLDYDVWSGIQFALLAILAGGILVHVMLHWSWVCNVIASRFGRSGRARVDEGMQTIYGVGLLIGLLVTVGVVVAAATLAIRSP